MWYLHLSIWTNIKLLELSLEKNLACTVETPLHWSVVYIISSLMVWIIYNVCQKNVFQFTYFVLLGRKLWIMLIHFQESLTTFINGLENINLDQNITLLLLLMGEFASHTHFLHFLYWVSSNWIIIPVTGTHVCYRARGDSVRVSHPGRYRLVNLQGLQMLGLSVKGWVDEC